MNETCDRMQALMSGHLDGELGPDETALVEAHVAECEACAAEFGRMKVLVSAASGLVVEAVPDEVWDTFLDNVYNRLERRTGWWILLAGLVVLACALVYLFVIVPWVPLALKVSISVVFAGLTVLFISVLRERLFKAKTDRYSRDVKR